MGGHDDRGRDHLPALDGVRGLAVLAVLAFHLATLDGGDRSGLLPGGWLGVDAFFTLSGYLITSLLLTETAATGRVDLRAFWRRRLRRLQPAALVTVAAVVATATWWAAPGTAGLVREEALSALGAVANWQALWAHRPYAAGVAPSGFEHFWSLAVEEQFYLVWPVVIAGLAVVRAKRWILLALAGGGTVVSWVLLARYPLQRGYLGTDARVGSILLGAALAVLFPMGRAAATVKGRRIASRVAVTGALAVGVLWVVGGWPPNAPLGLVVPLHALATAAVLAGVVLAPNAALSRLLAMGPLAVVGRVSYGVYLWHWPVFVLITPERLGAGLVATSIVRLALVAVLVAVSWFVVEHPIRRGIVLPRTRIAFPAAAVAVVAVAVMSVRAVDPTPSWARADGRLVVHAASATSPAADPAEGAVRRPARVLVVGDSIATSIVSGPTDTLQMALGHLFDQLAFFGISGAAATITGCPVVEHVMVAEGEPNRSCIELLRRRLPAAMEQFGPDLVVWYSRQEAYPFLTHDGEVSTSQTILRQRYAERVAWFAERGARVLLVSPGPNADGWEWNSPDRRPESMRALDRTLAQVAVDNPNEVVGVVRMADLLCSATTTGCPDRRPDGGRYRIDGVHFLGEGGDAASAWLAQQIATIDLNAGVPSRP